LVVIVMDSLEATISKDVTLYTVAGLLLRFVLYGAQPLQLIGLFVTLSFLVGVGGALLALGRQGYGKRMTYTGFLLVIIGLLPLQYFF
jgi:hypothetical protein